MNTKIINIAIIILLFSTSLILFLIFRLSDRIKEFENYYTIINRTNVGNIIPRFKGRRECDGASITSLDLQGHNVVLVFLSSKCSACIAKSTQLLKLLPGMARAGVTFWIATDDTQDISAIVGGSALESHVLRIGADTRRRLNPSNLVPSYIFIDDQMVVRDQSHMEDENWIDFVKQMEEHLASMANG